MEETQNEGQEVGPNGAAGERRARVEIKPLRIPVEDVPGMCARGIRRVLAKSAGGVIVTDAVFRGGAERAPGEADPFARPAGLACALAKAGAGGRARW